MAGIYKRGKVYWARAQRHGIDHRRSLKTADRQIAERRLRQWLDELDAISWGDKPRRLFEEATEKFITEHLVNLKPSSARRYGDSLKHLAAFFDGKPLDLISFGLLSEFETRRRTDGVKAPTIRRDLACLSSLMTSAEDWEWIDAGKNIVPAFLRRRAKRGLKESGPRTRYLSVAEESALLASCSSTVRAAVIMAIDTGLRRNELFDLKWPQVDLVRNIVRTTKNTKNGRERHVPIPARSAQYLTHLPRRIDSPFVMVNPDTGTRYHQMNKGLKAAIRRAGIDDLCWHDLRRTAGCRWLQRDGLSIEQVSSLLGHSSVTITASTYAFLESEVVAEGLANRTKAGTRTSDNIVFMKLKQ